MLAGCHSEFSHNLPHRMAETVRLTTRDERHVSVIPSRPVSGEGNHGRRRLLRADRVPASHPFCIAFQIASGRAATPRVRRQCARGDLPVR